MTPQIAQRLKDLPNKPGCYIMRDRQGVIIYVGKAKNLRRRVSSYFRAGARHAPKVRSMVSTIADFEFMTVKNEAEALLTEASLIKKYKPHFNILMRDDKRYLALKAETSATWPRFTCVRIIRDDGDKYFGPFPSSPVVRAAKDFVEKRYGIRECEAIEPDAETHRHCLADVIRTCSAPCIGRVTAEEYRERFDEACAFLEGRRPAVFAEVEEAMREAAARGDYEKAARLRDTLFAIKELTKSHFVRKSPQMRAADAQRGIEELAEAIGLAKPPRVIECVDISNLFGTHNVASLVVAVAGLPDGRYYRHFKISSFEGADDPRAMAEVVRDGVETIVGEHNALRAARGAAGHRDGSQIRALAMDALRFHTAPERQKAVPAQKILIIIRLRGRQLHTLQRAHHYRHGPVKRRNNDLLYRKLRKHLFIVVVKRIKNKEQPRTDLLHKLDYLRRRIARIDGIENSAQLVQCIQQISHFRDRR